MKIENLTALMKILSWTKIIQLFILMIVVGIGYGLWDNRTIVYNSLKVGARVEYDGPVTITVSESSKLYIDTVVTKSSGFIAGIEIISVDFKKNTRSTSYFSISNYELKKLYEKYLDNRVAPAPLFTSTEVFNQRVIDLINGEFKCTPISQTLISYILHGIDKQITTICSISIPPFYGRFSGYMNIYLNREPTESDSLIIRQISRDIALRVYEIDIYKSSQPSRE